MSFPLPVKMVERDERFAAACAGCCGMVLRVEARRTLAASQRHWVEIGLFSGGLWGRLGAVKAVKVGIENAVASTDNSLVLWRCASKWRQNRKRGLILRQAESIASLEGSQAYEA